MPFVPDSVVLGKISALIGCDTAIAEQILTKADEGGEMGALGQDEWFEERLKPNVVFLDENGYARMCVDALKIIGHVSATDMGASRQRDLAQIWADMTRGYLGELAFTTFLEQRFSIKSKLAHQRGRMEDFLNLDICEIALPGQACRPPKIKLGIKTSKWNGIWLDIPGDQFAHSDIHVFVKIGVGNDHLMAFMKAISVMKDKVLKKGVEVGSLTEDDAAQLYDELPSFKPIPAYICGFAKKIDIHTGRQYTGKKGRLHFTIETWKGPWSARDLASIKETESVAGKVIFKNIGKFSHDSGFLFNAGNLYWSDSDWKKVISEI